jgi:hypothetical protein
LLVDGNGKAWKRVPSPDPGGPGRLNQLDAVTASSASSARAVGSYVDPVLGDTALILQWNGTRWKHVASPAFSNSELFGVTGTSAASSWAVGRFLDETSQAFQALAVHCC